MLILVQKVQAIIFAQFADGSGNDKVKSGEYELFDSLSRGQTIPHQPGHFLRPGMSIVMAFIVGRYCHDLSEEDRCPRPGCLGRVFHSLGGNERQWYSASAPSRQDLH